MNNRVRPFKLVLDRSPEDPDEMCDTINNDMKQLINFDKTESVVKKAVKNNLNCFKYILGKSPKGVINMDKGIANLYKCIGYVLAFSPTL